MELISTTEYLAWAIEHEIGRSAEYPNSPDLTYRGAAATWRRYRRPPADSFATFAKRALHVAVAEGSFWLFPAGEPGTWVPPLLEDVAHLAPLRRILLQSGLTKESVGALRCEVRDLPRAGAILAGAFRYAGPLWKLAVVPMNAQAVLCNDEDGDLLAFFPTERQRASYTTALRRAGWEESPQPDPRVSETDPWLGLS